MKIRSFFISFKLLVLLYILIVVILCVIRIKRVQTQGKHSFKYYLFFIFYYMILVDIVVFPITFLYGAPREEIESIIGESWKNIQLIPFETIRYEITYEWGIVQIIGNTLLLMPFVFQQLLGAGKSIIKVLGLTILVSIVIELQQLLNNYLTRYPSHAIDIDDVILNVFGGVLVIIFYNFFCRKKNITN